MKKLRSSNQAAEVACDAGELLLLRIRTSLLLIGSSLAESHAYMQHPDLYMGGTFMFNAGRLRKSRGAARSPG